MVADAALTPETFAAPTDVADTGNTQIPATSESAQKKTMTRRHIFATAIDPPSSQEPTLPSHLSHVPARPIRTDFWRQMQPVGLQADPEQQA